MTFIGKVFLACLLITLVGFAIGALAIWYSGNPRDHQLTGLFTYLALIVSATGLLSTLIVGLNASDNRKKFFKDRS